MNQVKLQGIVVAARKGKTITRLTLKVHTNGTDNFPVVSFSTLSKKTAADVYSVGDMVCVDAKIRPGTERGNSDKVVFYKQVLEGVSIREASRDELDTKNILSASSRIPHINDVQVIGEVVSLKADKNVLSILICPENEVNNIWITCFSSNKVSEIAQKLSPGTNVCIDGEIQTKVIGDLKTGRRFENVIAKSITDINDTF